MDGDELRDTGDEAEVAEADQLDEDDDEDPNDDIDDELLLIDGEIVDVSVPDLEAEAD